MSKPISTDQVKHFRDEEWVDFTRNVLLGSRRIQINEHLKQRCKQCEESWEHWSQVVHAAMNEAKFRPPEEVVERVKTWFNLSASSLDSPLGETLGTLIFDSRWQRGSNGVRSLHAACRQLLFQKGTLYVDISIECDQDSPYIHVIGQIQDSIAPLEPMAAFRVNLWNGDKEIASTSTNDIGEFYLTSTQTDNLQLQIAGNKGEARLDLQSA